MQHPHHEGPPPLEPSRRRPPRAPSADPLPIPEAAGRTASRTSGVQDVLAAHQRAVDARIEDGLREIRLAVSEAVGRAVGEPVEPDVAERPERAPVDDIIRGLITHTEERFQALSLRLRRIEDVLRSVAKREGPDMERHLDALRRSITSVAATHQQEFARVLELNRETAARLTQQQRTATERLAKYQRSVAEILAKQQRTEIDELGKRLGRGITAVAQRLKEDLQARQDAMLERYLRGLSSELRRNRPATPSRPEPAPAAASRPAASPTAAEPATRPAPSAEPPSAPPIRAGAPPVTVDPSRPTPPPGRPVTTPPGPESAPSAAATPVAPERTGSTEPRQEPRHYLIERKPRSEEPRSAFPSEGIVGDADRDGAS